MRHDGLVPLVVANTFTNASTKRRCEGWVVISATGVRKGVRKGVHKRLNKVFVKMIEDRSCIIYLYKIYKILSIYKIHSTTGCYNINTQLLVGSEETFKCEMP